jgi:hypothetical protein
MMRSLNLLNSYTVWFKSKYAIAAKLDEVSEIENIE